MSIIQKFICNSQPITFEAAELQQNNPLLSLPAEILEKIGLCYVANGATPQEGTRNAVHLWGRMCVLAYQSTQGPALQREIHRGKFLMARDALFEAIKSDREYKALVEAEALYTLFKKTVSPQVELYSQEFIDLAFSAVLALKEKFEEDSDRDILFGIDEYDIVLNQFSKRIMADLLSRFVRKPLHEIHYDSYVRAMQYVTSLFSERKIIESPMQRWEMFVHGSLRAGILEHHPVDEITAMFLNLRDQARTLCLARMPAVYNEAKAMETEYLFLEVDGQTEGEIARLERELKQTQDEELQRQLTDAQSRREILTTWNFWETIVGGEMHALWQQLKSDPEIKKAKIDAAFYRALSLPSKANAFEEYKRFFMRIDNFLLL